MSEYFASEACQRTWTRRQAGLPADGRRTLRSQINAVLHALDAANGDTDSTAYVYTDGWQEITDHVARWWSYDRRRMLWELRESDGVNTRSLHYISDEAARQTQTAGRIEAYLRRRFGGHIPPIPARYMP